MDVARALRQTKKWSQVGSEPSRRIFKCQFMKSQHLFQPIWMHTLLNSLIRIQLLLQITITASLWGKALLLCSSLKLKVLLERRLCTVAIKNWKLRKFLIFCYLTAQFTLVRYSKQQGRNTVLEAKLGLTELDMLEAGKSDLLMARVRFTMQMGMFSRDTLNMTKQMGKGLILT